MMKLEQLKPNAAIRGIVPDALVTVVNVQWFGSEALEHPVSANELLYRHDESRLELVEHGRPWSFDGDGALPSLIAHLQRRDIHALADEQDADFAANHSTLNHLNFSLNRARSTVKFPASTLHSYVIRTFFPVGDPLIGCEGSR